MTWQAKVIKLILHTGIEVARNLSLGHSLSFFLFLFPLSFPLLSIFHFMQLPSTFPQIQLGDLRVELQVPSAKFQKPEKFVVGALLSPLTVSQESLLM